MNAVSSESKSAAISPASVQAAYRFCDGIAKREAKNFYYAFRILPRRKRQAMSAVYAFMRRADDISDDESVPVELRRTQMAEWLSAWRASTLHSTLHDADPVFIAVRDAQARFAITDQLLDDLVRGTTMDLESANNDAHGLQTFNTFETLYRYCYLVASVVGLVSIRIFGYTNASAELLAERLGIAFQLTNILRDVKEDAERGRIYLPVDRLRMFKLEPPDLVSAVRPLPGQEGIGDVPVAVRSLVMSISGDAHRYYAASSALLPLIDADSRAALWVLVAIYNRLLRRIDSRSGDVFSERVRVPAWEKLLILARGTLLSFYYRVTG